MIIRDDHVEFSAVQCPFKRLPVADALELRLDAFLRQHGAHQLGEIRLVFQMQNVQAPVHSIIGTD